MESIEADAQDHFTGGTDHLEADDTEEGHSCPTTEDIESECCPMPDLKSADPGLDLVLQIVQDTSHPACEAINQRIKQLVVAGCKVFKKEDVTPLEDELATTKADLVTVKDELAAVKSLSVASKEDVVTKYIVKPLLQDELERVADDIHRQLLTDLRVRTARDFGSEARQFALNAQHEFRDDLNNTNKRMHEQAGDVMDLSKAHGDTKQHIDRLEATIRSQATTIATLSESNEKLTTDNTNILERFAKLEAAVSNQQGQLKVLSAVPAGVSALETKLETFSDPNGESSVSAVTDPAIAGALKQHGTQFKDHASQLEKLSGVKSSVDTATEQNIQHEEKIDALEEKLEKTSTSQEQIEKHIEDIRLSLREQESVPTQIEDLQERIKALDTGVNHHAKGLKLCMSILQASTKTRESWKTSFRAKEAYSGRRLKTLRSPGV